jgi:hypothetical protein
MKAIITFFVNFLFPRYFSILHRLPVSLSFCVGIVVVVNDGSGGNGGGGVVGLGVGTAVILSLSLLQSLSLSLLLSLCHHVFLSNVKFDS